MIAVGGVGKGFVGDLKNMIRAAKEAAEEGANANRLDLMYIKQAEHMLRTDSYLAAVRYTMKALEINPESIVRNYTN